jgi:hypothetical protein
MCANTENFEKSFLENPIGLHFSGHGYKNNEKTIGNNYWMLTKDGGSYCLLLEGNR